MLNSLAALSSLKVQYGYLLNTANMPIAQNAWHLQVIN